MIDTRLARWVSLLALAPALLASCADASTSAATSSTRGGGGATGTGSGAGTTAGTGAGGGATGGGGGAGGVAAGCRSGDTEALAVLGDDVPDGSGTPETAITIDHVGTQGTYNRVTAMNPGTFGQPCPADACVKQSTPVSGPLSPFDEEMTVVFAGPMEIYDLAVYEPRGEGWRRVSSWNRCASENITFLNNKGGGASGEWTQCGGNSQSFASSDGTAAAPGPVAFGGALDTGVELNIVSGSACEGQGDGSACGFYRGVGMHGWSGPSGEKIFAMRVRMARVPGGGGVTPADQGAIWMLNARIVRTAQYGCNCRGVGSPGGCGELDVAEILKGSGHPTHATTTIYSYQGAIGADGASGAGHYFLRPVNRTATFIAVFRATGSIHLLRLAPDAFDFGPALDPATVEAWTAQTGFRMALP